jgi:hypothetical protein
MRGQDTAQSSFGQSTMADLPPSWPSEAANFSDAEGREIIVQHKILRAFTLQTINELFIALGAQRYYDERLGLSTREQG